jgi:Uma2 family endonuclease
MVAVVDPQRTVVAVYRPDGRVLSLGAIDVLLLPDLLPGWSLPLAELFRYRVRTHSFQYSKYLS